MNGGYDNTDSRLTVQNSTISGNRATSDGGGIFNFTGGTVTLTDVTFRDNIPNDCTVCPGTAVTRANTSPRANVNAISN